MTGEADHRLYRLETTRHRCPMCGAVGFCDVSPHPWFREDRIAIRCRECRHVWPDRPLSVPEIIAPRVTEGPS